MIEDCITGEQRSVICFLWAKKPSAKDIHKDTFPVYGKKCLSRNAVHNWVANVSLMTKMQVSTHWYSDGRSVPVLVEDMSRNKCFFQVLILQILRLISICDLFTDSPVDVARCLSGNIEGALETCVY
jgi:hypothetical protein